MDEWVDEIMREFVAALLHEVKLPNSREAMYSDYASFCLARGKDPVPLPAFCNGLQQVIDQVVERLCQ